MSGSPGSFSLRLLAARPLGLSIPAAIVAALIYIPARHVSHHQIRATRNIPDCPAVSDSSHRILVPAVSLVPGAASSEADLHHRSAHHSLFTSTDHTSRTFLLFRRPRHLRLVTTLRLLFLLRLLCAFIVFAFHIYAFFVFMI